MKALVRSVLFFLICTVFLKEAEARSICGSLMARAAGLALMISPAAGAPYFSERPWQVDSRTQDIWNSTWTYERMNEIRISPATSPDLFRKVQDTHDLFSDFVYFTPVSLRADPGYWPGDRWLPTNIAPSRWTQVAGGWGSQIVTAPRTMPVEAKYGVITIYDETPNTPGLYQFTTIDYGHWPFFVIVTHYAWLELEPRFEDFSIFERSFNIPAPMSLTLAAGSALFLQRRSRRP